MRCELRNTTGILESALEHRRLGLRLVALRGKAAFMKRWQDLTLTENTVRAFARSGCNFAAVTGHTIIVVDTDNEQAEARAAVLKIESCVEVISGGGGRHRYFAAPDGIEVRGRQGLHAIHGFDVKAKGGYIVLPAPSTRRLAGATHTCRGGNCGRSQCCRRSIRRGCGTGNLRLVQA